MRRRYIAASLLNLLLQRARELERLYLGGLEVVQLETKQKLAELTGNNPEAYSKAIAEAKQTLEHRVEEAWIQRQRQLLEQAANPTLPTQLEHGGRTRLLGPEFDELLYGDMWQARFALSGKYIRRLAEALATDRDPHLLPPEASEAIDLLLRLLSFQPYWENQPTNKRLDVALQPLPVETQDEFLARLKLTGAAYWDANVRRIESGQPAPSLEDWPVWWYRHRVEGESLLEIAEEAFEDETRVEEVKHGVSEVERLFGLNKPE